VHRKAGFPEPAGCWGKDVVTGGDRHLGEPGVEVVGPEERVNVDKEFEVGSVGTLGKPHRTIRPTLAKVEGPPVGRAGRPARHVVARGEEQVPRAEADSFVVGSNQLDDPVRRVRATMQVVEINDVEPCFF
ncbi:uncharacterized protein METZ01_LOCUS97502, partial [marine metagenome]